MALALSIPPFIFRQAKDKIFNNPGSMVNRNGESLVLGGSALSTTKKESGRSRFPSCPERASLYDVGCFEFTYLSSVSNTNNILGSEEDTFMNNIKRFHGVGTENHRSWEAARIFAYIESIKSKAERTHRQVNDPYPLGIFETTRIQ